MGNIGTTTIIITIIVIFLTGLVAISDDINKNPNLDTKSKQLLTDLGVEVNSSYTNDQIFNSTSLVNNTPSDPTAFSLQYLESKNQINQQKSTLDVIFNLPSLFIKMLGVENENLIISWNILIISLITLLIGLQIYKAIRTGEVD